MRLEEYPKELTKKRNEIEGNFVMSLFKEPDLIDDYSSIKNGEDIITDDGIFYYGIAQNMYKLGYRVFDHVSINTYLNDKESLKKGFETRGGYKVIQDIISTINTENIDVNYDELVKNNMLLRLYEEDFPVMKNLKVLSEMNSEEVYDYFDFKLAETVSDKVEKNKVVNLSVGYENFIKEWNEGSQIGYPISLPMLNKRLLGVHKKNLLLHMAHTGKGKTTTAIVLYILPAIERGENVLIIANEQSENEWRNMLLAAILFNKIGDVNMNRSKISEGHYTKEQFDKLMEAAHWLGTEGRGNIEFADLDDYSISKAKKIIKKYSKLGYGMVILDTLKPEQESSDKAWAEFNETAKNVFKMAKKLDIAVIATAQLTPSSMSNYYLDTNDIGKGKGICETANQVVMFRFVFNDEKTKLKPYTFKKNEDGKFINVKEIHNLDPDKSYIVFFIPKNRAGETTTQIVAEWNPSFMTMHQIGYVSISPNGSHRT